MTDTGSLVMFATFGMEIVECGGAIARHVRAGGTAYAAVAFARAEAKPQVRRAAEILGIRDVRFLDLDIGDVQSNAETKLPLVRLVREWKPNIAIMQDPVHAFGDLDPGRRDIMNVYMEALALAGRSWRDEECGGFTPHQTHAIYYMTPSAPNCVVDVAPVWQLKEQAMDQLGSQMAFSGAHYKQMFSTETLKVLAPWPIRTATLRSWGAPFIARRISRSTSSRAFTVTPDWPWPSRTGARDYLRSRACRPDGYLTARVVMRKVGMVIDAGVIAGIDVHAHVGQLGHRMEHGVARTFGHRVRLAERQLTIGDDLRIGHDVVAQPARAQIGDTLNAFGLARGFLSTLDHLRIDRVHEPMPDLNRGVFEHQQDGNRNQQADERVGLREA